MTGTVLSSLRPRVDGYFDLPRPVPVLHLETMTAFEIAIGAVTGVEPDNGPVDSGRAPLSPVAALEAAVLDAVKRSPCVVTFSGGRDSSLTLAMAAHTAKKEGLPAPIAVTNRFPDLAETLEDEWQERVIRHLQIADWIKIPLGDEMDALSPLATTFLSEHGVVWPPMLWNEWRVARLARGGSLVGGDGGDEVFGARRVTPIAYLLDQRDMNPLMIRRSMSALTVGPVRRRVLRHRYRTRMSFSWLKPPAVEEATVRLTEQYLSEPLRWSESIRWERCLRSQAVATRNFARLASAAGATRFAPLLNDAFLSALGQARSRLGYATRTAALRAHFADLLPDGVLARRSKASFNGAWYAAYTRAFMKRWDGGGLDENLVDIKALRDELSNPRPSAMVSALLQSAWIASR